MFWVEVLVVSILLVIVGMPLYFMLACHNTYIQPWQIAVMLAISGAVVHIFCEISGLNSLYCKVGNACKKRP